MSADLQDWAARVLAAISHLSNPSLGLVPPPMVGEEELGALMTIRQTLAPQDRQASPWRDAILRIASNASESFRPELTDALTRMLHGIDAAIDAALDAGAQHDGLIRTADFGELLSLATESLVAGMVSSLPPSHRLRGILSDVDWLRIDGRPALVLGPVLPDRKPRRFYPTAQAVALTRAAAGRQRWQEQDEARLARHQAEVERQRLAATSQGSIAELRRRVSELEAKR